MLQPKAGAALIVSLLALSACGRDASAPSEPPPATPGASTVNASMTKVMAVEAQTVWDITSQAFNARGDGLEGAKISAEAWTQLGQAGRRLQQQALTLADSAQVVVAGPGETIMGADAVGAPASIGHAWDPASASQIQARIDADPARFAEDARALARVGETLAKAADARDVATVYQVSSGLDEVCDRCHARVWGTDEPPPFPKAAQRP